MAGVDIWTFNEDGKAIEHWDVLQAIPEATASRNDLFSQLHDRLAGGSNGEIGLPNETAGRSFRVTCCRRPTGEPSPVEVRPLARVLRVRMRVQREREGPIRAHKSA